MDTCILCTASDTVALGSIGDSCWFFLELLIQSIHKAVLSKELEEQWDESFSYTIHASTWRNWLISSRKLEFFYGKTRDDRLRSKILSLDKYPDICKSEVDKMREDVLLLELALLTDNTIVSVNWKDRKKFCKAASYINGIGSIIWADPHKHRSDIKRLLDSGANPVDEWKLGYQAP